MRLLAVAVFLIAVSPAFAASSEPPDAAGASAPTANGQAEMASDDAKAARLDALFAALRLAPSAAAGKEIEQRILVEWHHSGDKEIDKLFSAALVAMDIRAFNAALSVLDKVIEAKPDFAEGWNKRATVYYYVNEFDRSMADIEHTLALEPRHFGALAGLGMIMQDTGNLRGAIAAFEQAVAINPSLTNLKTAIEQLRARISRDI